MYITIDDINYELSTKLGVAMQIEKRFKSPIMQVFGRLNEALSDELIDLICIAAGKFDSGKSVSRENIEFRQLIKEKWDYFDLFYTTQELVAKLMFSGSDEQNESKIQKLTGASEEQKNSLRALIGLPLKAAAPGSDGKI